MARDHGLDHERCAGCQPFTGELDRVDGVVPHRLGSHVDKQHRCRHRTGLIRLSRRTGIPSPVGAIGKYVDLTAVEIRTRQKPSSLGHCCGERARGRSSLESLHPCLRLGERRRKAGRGAGSVHHRHFAAGGELTEQDPGHLCRPLQPRLIARADLHPGSRVEYKSSCHWSFRVRQPACAAEHGSGEGQRDQQDRRDPKQQQQQVAQSKPAAVANGPLLEKSERRKEMGHRFPLHQEVQQDRRGHQGHSPEQERRKKRQSHGLEPPSPTVQVLDERPVELHARVERNIIDASAETPGSI